MPKTVRLSQRGGCFSVAGAFTNQLNNKETRKRRKTGKRTGGTNRRSALYSEIVVGKGPSLVEGVNFLQKQYHPQQPAQTVRDRLDRREEGG
jgi:hypothetical protein